MATVEFSDTTQVEITLHPLPVNGQEMSEEKKFQLDNRRGFWIWAGCAITLVVLHFVQDLPRLLHWFAS